MKVTNSITRLLGTATLVLALSIFDISMKPKATYQTGHNFAGFVDRLTLINEAMAGTDILTGGDGSLPHHIRFMYFLINGAPNGYPAGMDGPEGGFLGMIRQITGPTALGGGLREAGYSVCTDIPATGNASMVEEGNGTYKMFFETPQKTIPAGYTGAGSTFEKRVVVQFDGTTFFNIEFNCATSIGWIRMNMGESNPTAGVQRNIEVYYDTQDSANAKLELYMVNEPGLTTGNEYFAAKFQTLSSSTFKFWIVRSQNKTGNIFGFRASVHGDTGSKNLNAFFLSESSSLNDTSTNHTDNNDITAASGGDIQCLDYSAPDTPVAGTGCSSLGLTDAGAPVNDSAGGFSISWTGDTSNGLKNKMTAVAQPVNP